MAAPEGLRLLRTLRHLPRVAVCVALLTPPAWAGPLDDVQTRIVQISELMNQLETRYLAPEILEREHKLTARLSDGQLFFLTKEYDRAAMVLLDVVEDPGSRSHPAYRDAVFFLSESLFRMRNFTAASGYYEEVIARGTPEQQQTAVARLLEMALETRDEKGARAYLSRASQILQVRSEPTLLYAVGKFHYRVGELDQARPLFEQVPRDHELFRRARYFLGVLSVRLGRLDDAQAAFQEAAAPAEDGGPPTGNAAEVADLARLAIARVFYEQGLFAQAVDAYASVSRNSAHFDEALYESVWISIKQDEYEKALRKLEILLISQPDVIRGSDARLLQGKLLMMLGRYDDASVAFQDVLSEFGPLQSEMRTVRNENAGDLEGHFNRVIDKNLAEFDLASFLPPRAAEFAGTDAESSRALQLVSDLAAEKRDVDDADRTIARLEIAINADNRVEVFPRLHEGWIRALEARAQLTLARGRLNDEAGTRVPGDAEHGALRDTRREWEARFKGVPTTAVQMQARDARVDDEMARLDMEAFKLSIQIRGLEAQLVAIDKYVADLSVAGTSVPGGEEAVLEQVQRELRETQTLRDELTVVLQGIESERIQVGVNDYAAAKDDRIRARYVASLDAEERWLAQNGAPVDADILRQVEGLAARTDAFLAEARKLVDGRVADIRRQLERERQNLGGYTGELATYQGETESLGGKIAARSFRDVLQRVDDVVIEADVGLVDVAWKQKHDKAGQISDMLGRQRAEMDALDREYREVNLGD